MSAPSNAAYRDGYDRIFGKKHRVRGGTYMMRPGGALERVSDHADADDPSTKLRKDRVMMWTELPRHMNPAAKKWKKWTKGKMSFPVIDGDSDRREYQAMCRDNGYGREWVK